MTTNNNNPNPLYPKGSTYHNYTEIGPVLDAIVATGATPDDREPWYEDSGSNPMRSVCIAPIEFPITLTRDIQAPYEAPYEAPKPLTVEEMREVCFKEDAVYCWNPLDEVVTFTYSPGELVALNIPCYATEDDCKRAHELGVE